MQASKEAKVCPSVLQVERNDDSVWDALLDKATDIAALYKKNQSIPPAATLWKRRGGYSFRLLEESNLLPISGSPYMGSQRRICQWNPNRAYF